MSDEQIRLECMKLALRQGEMQDPPLSAEVIIETAKRVYDFVTAKVKVK